MQRKCKNTATLKLQNSYIELISKIPEENLTITDICKSASVSRTSFYNNFDNLNSVIEDLENAHLEELRFINIDFFREDFEKYTGFDRIDYFDKTLNYINNNCVDFRALLSRKSSRFRNNLKTIIKNDFEKKYKYTHSSIANMDLKLEMIASAILGSYEYWVNNNKHISINEISSIFKPLCSDFIRIDRR